MSILTRALIVFFIVSLVPGGARAALRCEDVFIGTVQSSAKIHVDFDARIPADKRERVVQIIDKVKLQLGDLSFPDRVVISLGGDGEREGGAAELLKDKINISQMAFKLSNASFDALMAHEFTHLVVVRGLHELSSKDSLLQAMLKADGDSMSQLVLMKSHSSFAELLCDTMSVLVTGNTKAISDLMNEIGALAEQDPILKKAVANAFRDQPAELSRRDFSLSPEDSRWDTYSPEDMDYNRFNQIRAFLGTNWIQKIQPGKRILFFPALLKALDPVFGTGQIDMLMAYQGLPAANKALIQYLDQSLAKTLGTL
jgi:hypothetical protein